MSYIDIYRKRINHYGNTPQERLEKRRQENFQRFLLQSPHRTTFLYNDEIIECVFEPFSQDETKTLMYILCDIKYYFNIGDIIDICNQKYMFYYQKERKNSGYNRWVVIRINYHITWLNEDGNSYDSEAYIFDQENNMLKNELKSRSRSAALYLENLKLAFMIMPTNKNIKINSYLTITINDISRSYRITGFDFISTPGILYISMDPTITRDLTPPPQKQPDDNDNDYFWLGGM